MSTRTTTHSNPLITWKFVVISFNFLGSLIAFLTILNIMPNRVSESNVYGIPESQLSEATRLTLTDPNYQNIILPEELDKNIADNLSFFVYYFSATCPHCIETTPKLNSIITITGVDVSQFNLDVYKNGFSKYGIMYTPTLIYYENGVEKDRIEGGINNHVQTNSEDAFKKFFEKHKETTSS